MTPVAFGSAVFLCVMSGALLGIFLRMALPERHLGEASRDLVRLAMGLLATMSALVVGLLITTAKTAYDTQIGQFRRMSAEIALLDRSLAHYGPEAGTARELLRRSVAHVLERIDSESSLRAAAPNPTERAEEVYDLILKLAPQGEVQRSLRAEALRLGADIGLMRWLMFAERGSSIPQPFLLILAVWFTILFSGFGLFARFDGTVLATVLLCALSLAAAVFLILELEQPFEGLIKMSTKPLRDVMLQLGR